MKKFLMMICLILSVLTIFSACASNGNGSSGNSGETPSVPEIPSVTPDEPNFDQTKFPAELTEIPTEYFRPAERQGKLRDLYYDTYESFSYESKMQTIEKHAVVYLPYDYDETKKYNVVYLMHGGWSNENSTLGTPSSPSDFKNVIDNAIGNGVFAPLIVVCPTYNNTSGHDSADFSLALRLTRNFHNELINDLIPAVESTFSTYAEGTSESELKAARDHRAFGGFSMGSVTTWRTFEYALDYFRYFIPMSCGTSLDDEEIWRAADGRNQNDYFVMMMVGTSDFSYSYDTARVQNMLSSGYFTEQTENTDGNFIFRVKNGYSHNGTAANEYTYNVLSYLWKTSSATEQYTADTRISDVINDPVFGDFGRLIFPVNSGYYSGDTLENLRLTWYNNINVAHTVEICNYLKNQTIAGNRVFYDIYTDEEKAADPRKENTGLFFFRGEKNAKFAVTCAGGGTEEIGEGYTKKFTANWFNEDDLQIADLSAITNNVTVYYGEDATIYNNHTCPNYANIMGLNKYIKADADGNITFMVRYHGGNKNFWVHQKIGGSSVNLWAEAEQWYIVTTDSASGSVYISDANGKKLAENVFDGFDVTTMLFSANEPGTTIDVAAVVVITGDEYTLEERLTIDLNATIVDGTIQSGAEDITLDLSSVYTPSAEMNAKVIVDGVEYNATISAEGIVSFANPFDINKYGEYAVKVQVGRDVINANALIVTKVVTTKEEFTALNTYAAAMNMGGYYMLGNDISVSELDAKEHQIGDASSPFVGTIDGNGHKVTVWNFYDRTYGNGPWIFNFQGVIKNISLEFKYLAKYARIIRIGNGGTLENVYLSLKKTDYGDGAFMFQQSCGKMNLKNVVVDVTEITSASGYTIFGQATKVDGVVGGVEVMKATFTNVVVKTNSAFANSIGLENTDGVKSGIYVSFADTAATNGVDFPAEGWDNKYWTVSGENVTWKNA